MQIIFETLIVVIDIRKGTHYTRAFDFRRFELAKLLRFSNSRQTMKHLKLDADDNAGARETETVVGFEPAGHCWFTLGDYLQRKGYRLGIVNQFHAKCTKEQDDNSPNKNDRKVLKTIAMMVKDGIYREVYISEDLLQ